MAVRKLFCGAMIALLFASSAFAQATSSVASDGSVELPQTTVPFSSLASPEAKRNFIDITEGFRRFGEAAVPGDIQTNRKRLDELLTIPGVERLRRHFPVHIEPKAMAGVMTDVVTPAGGVPPRNRGRVLINLHGGGFMVAARYGGQQESIPIASLGGFKIITVDYRMAPEHQFPAASDDVVQVYRELLAQGYLPQNVGIYGCSAGGVLTAQVLAMLQQSGLPAPGAAGIFGAGALVPTKGDSNTTGSLLMGRPIPSEDAKRLLPYFSVPGLDTKAPLVSPAHHPGILARFPPTLLIAGTRDQGLSAAAYTHAQLTTAGVDADLHVWEGMAHCSFAQGVVDPSVPETRQAWDVIVKFFEEHLGGPRDPFPGR